MNYYKHEGIVVKAENAPISTIGDTTFIVDGKEVDSAAADIAYAMGTEVQIKERKTVEWEKATEKEYKEYVEGITKIQEEQLEQANQETQKQNELIIEAIDSTNIAKGVSKEARAALLKRLGVEETK